MSDAGIQAKVESILLEADRRALRVLAPAARKLVVVLRSLWSGEKSEEDILADCIMLYPACRNVKPILSFLEKLGIVERRVTSGKYALTEFGKSVAEALYDIIKDLRGIIESVVRRGSVDPIDLYVQLVTPAMSMVEIAMDARSGSELMLSLVLHAYISTLMASTLSTLAKWEPRFRSVLELVEKMVMGEGEEARG